MNCAGCGYYWDMLIGKWIVRAHVSDGGVGQRSKLNLRNKFPTRAAKLEIISYYYFWEGEQIKKRTKQSRKLKFEPKSINPTKTKRKKPKARHDEHQGSASCLQAGQGRVHYPGVL